MMMVTVLLFAGAASAKVKEIQKSDKNYDFKAVKAIVVDPVTSNNVDFGKVDAERLPKIKAILEKTKKNMRSSMIEGAKNAKTSIPFYLKAPNRKDTTLIIKYNISQFDNGSQAARLVPFAGKAKVTIEAQFINAKTKQVVSEVQASAKAKGGVVAGGMDSEVLWSATNMANADIYKYLKKLTGLEYDFWSGAIKGTKTGVTNQTDLMKEEKREVDKKKK
jgi:hypothetical protein